jgi:uncharacterized membrane protein
VRDDLYNVFLLLHLVAAIAGFGAVVLNGIYDAKAKRLGGAEGRAVMEANYAVSTIGEYLIYSVPIWGFAMIGLSDGAISFGQTWIWLSLLLYVIALGISHGVVRPGAKQLAVARSEDVEKKVAAGGAALNVILVVIIALMIWKPGF